MTLLKNPKPFTGQSGSKLKSLPICLQIFQMTPKRGSLHASGKASGRLPGLDNRTDVILAKALASLQPLQARQNDGRSAAFLVAMLLNKCELNRTTTDDLASVFCMKVVCCAS